ncbi:MAG: hypothetical protein IKL57_01080 [Oscillospiraceae bacterium]|nr:hypothetical protein [Oscillospiraceae bacterium]
MDDMELDFQSTGETASNDVFDGLFEGEDFETEEPELFSESGEEPEEPQGAKNDPVGESGEPGAKEPENEPQNDGSGAETLSVTEHGKTFDIPKEAVEGLASALGITADKLIEIYQKGTSFDAQETALNAARSDTELIENIAKLRGLEAKDFRAELMGQIKEIPFKKALEEIKNQFPGIDENAAKELAKARTAEKEEKPAEPAKETNTEEKAARLREAEMFKAKHAAEGIEMLPNEVIDKWEKTGISLEEAYQSFKNAEKINALEKEIAALKKEKAEAEQKAYAKEHSTGSAKTSAGTQKIDEFVEGLFKIY